MLLEGTGRVIRMDQGRRDKKTFETKSEESRRTGRLRQRWLEDLREDLRETKVKRWRQKTVGGEEGASVIKEAKNVRGPKSQGVSKNFLCFTPCIVISTNEMHIF